MSASSSEAYLASLARTTFLAPWSRANLFYRSGKELSDFVIPFGNDIVIISDKASDFDDGGDIELAWARWYRKTIGDSLRQLRTAKQRVERAADEVFVDRKALKPLPFALASPRDRRFHLVGIARSRIDPTLSSPNWPGLVYTNVPSGKPFEIGPLRAAGEAVHLFDGPTIDLLLSELDTAHDFIAYLRGRGAAMAKAESYRVDERDLLAASVENWGQGNGLTPQVPELAIVPSGGWEQYARSDRRARSILLNRPSRSFDRIISIHDQEYSDGRVVHGDRDYGRHEFAMRLLASESRFARRMLAVEIEEIVNEPSSKFMAATMVSPSTTDLRYVFLAYPAPPENVSLQMAEAYIGDKLEKYVCVARGIFTQSLIMGIAIPKVNVDDTATYFRLLDGSDWSEADIDLARAMGKEECIFSDLEETSRVHVP